jgi:hypothetical protein
MPLKNILLQTLTKKFFSKLFCLLTFGTLFIDLTIFLSLVTFINIYEEIQLRNQEKRFIVLSK